MYHYNLHVTTYGLTDEEVGQLQAVKETKKITVTYTNPLKLDEALLLKSDILVCGGPWNKQLLELLLQNRGNCYIVLWVDAQNLAAQPDQLALAADALWPRKLDAKNLRVLWERALQLVRTFKDASFTTAYVDSLFTAIPDMVWFKNRNGIRLKVNTKFCEVVGKRRADIEGKRDDYIWNLTKEEYEAGEYDCAATDNKVVVSRQPVMFAEKLRYADNKIHYQNTYKAPVFSPNGEVIGIAGFAEDVTDIWNSKSELRLILDNLPLAILILDGNGDVRLTNKAFCKTFNATAEKIESLTAVQYEALCKKHGPVQEEHWEGNTCSYIFERVLQGKKHIFSCLRHPLLNQLGEVSGTTLLFEDITQEREALFNSHKQTITDQLTGVFNRHYYREIVEQLVKNKKSFTLVMFDLDNLKFVNDTFGHAAGDRYIVAAARFVQKHLDHEDVLCRIGGDEFVAFFHNCNLAAVEHIMQQVNTELASEGIEFPASLSYGCAVLHTPSFEEFRASATYVDAKMYEMKKVKK